MCKSDKSQGQGPDGQGQRLTLKVKAKVNNTSHCIDPHVGYRACPALPDCIV